ncbi:delta-class carbonic anhydrase [Vibrio mexicanus]|uniref:delta-class carbonic anhydrase n=1 Tax=Vibrio mexicanus TaxID=1004326 RepID=UPI00063C7CEA|nr:delta-class carbonic anhydrase [Vibrio mexicanus]
MHLHKASVVAVFIAASFSTSAETSQIVDDQHIQKQRAALAQNTNGKGYGPQSPRNIDDLSGNNPNTFSIAPQSTEMNLCNIHFHKNAEHAGGEFNKFAGNGDGNGFGTGYRYSGSLSLSEAKRFDSNVCRSDHGGLNAGDTIEVHFVHTTAKVTPGATLGACSNDATVNPQLRVETQVFVLVNDRNALNFNQLAKVSKRNGYFQATNMPDDTGKPIEYLGSTTGPAYNTKGSPYQVTWSVRPKVAKVDLLTVGNWCKDNIFNEDHAHGVRNLVVNSDLLSDAQM